MNRTKTRVFLISGGLLSILCYITIVVATFNKLGILFDSVKPLGEKEMKTFVPCIIIASIGFLSAVISILLSNKTTKEFNFFRWLVFVSIFFNTLTSIVSPISLRFSFIILLLIFILTIASSFYIAEMAINRKAFIIQGLIDEIGRDDVMTAHEGTSIYVDTIPSEDFGRASIDPSNKNQLLIERLRELRMFYESGMMSLEEFEKIRSDILNK